MLNITAYCRVSTDDFDQLNSLENQERYFKEYIESNPDWNYVPLYADEGLSGTSTKKRKNFRKMIADAHAGKFDVILTKEVSRFARNTVDTLQFTRELKEIGVGVIFITDNIDTRINNDEFRLTIMASVAQEESRRTSERVKWGQTRSMESGVIFGHKMLGYKRVGRGREAKLEIIPSEAETVKLIFHKYLVETKGLTTIARELEGANCLTGYGKRRWDASSVQRILTNEKYAGDLRQKKFITPNYLTHATKRNKGEENFIIVQDSHPAIIDRDTFTKTQAEIKRRGALEKVGKRHTVRYAFSGKLECGLCGATLINRNSKSSDGKERDIKRWRCGTSMKYGANEEKNGCSSKMIRNEILEHIFQRGLHDLVENKDGLINECVELVSSVLDAEQIHTDLENTQREKDSISSRINRLIDLRLDGEISKEELQTKRENLDRQIETLNERLTQLQKNADMVSERETLLGTIKNHISSIVYTDKFSDEVAKELLDKIVVHDKSRYDVYFRGANPVNFT